MSVRLTASPSRMSAPSGVVVTQFELSSVGSNGSSDPMPHSPAGSSASGSASPPPHSSGRHGSQPFSSSSSASPSQSLSSASQISTPVWMGDVSSQSSPPG